MKGFRNPIGLAFARGLRPWLLACVIAGCAAETAAPPAPTDTTGAAINALAARPIDPAKTRALLARANGLVRPGSVVQSEPQLGVPTFLWTSSKRISTSRMTALAVAPAAAHPQVAAARAVLADYAPLYGLADTDVADAVVVNVHDHGTGPILVKLRAQLGGIEIFGEELSVVMNRKLESVAISGYLTSAATPPAQPGGLAFGLAAPAGAAAVVGQLARTAIEPSWLVPAGSRDGYDYFTLAPAAGVALDEPIRVKRVYFHLPEGLEAAYYIEVIARTGAPPVDRIAADGSRLATTEAYAYVVSAATGQPLFRKNLIAEAANSTPRDSNALNPGGFTYRVWADPLTGIPMDSPAGNAVHPKVVAVPDGAQAPFIAPSDVTLANYAYSQNDPWIAPGATETLGNNVDAFANLFGMDGYGNPTTTTPTDPAAADFRAQITGPGLFLHTKDPDADGAPVDSRQAAIQQLFYDVNFFHDWYYDAGFDEAAGNAQTTNFARGGLGGDSIKAQVQDISGLSNSDMLTPADGARPRMRMYVFPSPANMIEVQAPSVIAGDYRLGMSMSGPQKFDVTGDIVMATFANTPSACTVTNAALLAGKIAMFDFDNSDHTGCSFSNRIAKLTVTTTATALLLVYKLSTPTVVVSIIGILATNTKPVATVTWNTGQLIKDQLATVPVTARLFRAADRDGALDAQIVAHEWFHYASNRLIANGAGLNSNMSSGMGEGWSDFNSLMLTVRSDDTQTPSNASFNGAYAIATFATSGVPFDGSQNNGYYYGIRRYPYSTDMTKNPLTFGDIANGVVLPTGPPVAFGADGASNAEVHNTGEVWTTMLWECYAALLRDTLGSTPRLTFQQAQDRMKQYLIAALKVTPPSPTFTEARDALLAVAYAGDPTDYVAFRFAFTRRGAGPHAVSPPRYSTTNAGVIEDFGTGPELAFDSATLDDTLGSCDGDGVLDHGEYGRLTVTLRNTGTVALSATTATISSTSSDVWYPSGTTLRFPATAPGATTTASLRLAYLRTVAGIQVLDLQIDYTDAQLTGGPVSQIVSFRTNTDEIAASSATDTVEPVAPPWTTGWNPLLTNAAPWRRVETTPLSHHWHVDDPNTGSDQYLVSPVFTVDGGGALNVQFDHSWSFEFDGGGNYDGGVVEMSVNGGGFTDIGVGYNGTILNYSGTINPLKGRQGYVKTSAGTIQTTLSQAIAPGSTVQIRFRSGSDAGIGAGGWDIDNIAFLGVVETPFATLVADGHSCTAVPESAELTINVDDGVASVTAGASVIYAITAANAGGDDIIGAAVTDVFPGDLTCTWTCAGSGAGGGCSASGTGNISELVTLPVGGAVTYTATCALAASTTAVEISNTATVAPPGPVTDPVPENNTSTDTDTVIHLPALLIAGKTVTGSFLPGTDVTYTIVLGNLGPGAQRDNPGAELIDILPQGLTLVSASATSGTTIATVVHGTVTWDGVIAPGASVTITIVATITASPGTTISNQATFNYDSDGNGTNDASGTTDAYSCAAPPGGLQAPGGPVTAAMRPTRPTKI